MSTDAPFDAAERREFDVLGFDIIPGTSETAHACGVMCVNAVRHGPFHFLLTVTLPNGCEISGFVPRSKLVPPPGDDAIV